MRIGHQNVFGKNEYGVVTGGASVGTGFTIAWQSGTLQFAADGVTPLPNGAFIEDVLGACHDRIEAMQATKFECDENAVALQAIRDALTALDGRMTRRQAEGLHGTHEDKTLDNVSAETASKAVSDIQFFGDGNVWKLLCKASSAKEGWMKSTKAMPVMGGCLVQVTTQQGDHVAEALAFVPNASVCQQTDSMGKLIGRYIE